MSKKKNKKEDTLDTETTFANMNVDGFRWYDPNYKGKSNTNKHKQKLSRKEYRQMVRAAFVAYLPIILIVTIVFAIMGALAWLWLN